MDTNGSMAFDWSWIVALLIIGGLFGGFGNWGNNANAQGVTEEYIANQFSQRDLYNNNTNILTTASATQNAILENRYNCSQNYSNLRYDMATGQANIDKDVLIGNQNILANQNQIALQNQAQMSSCCCEIKGLIRDEVQSVKDLINANTIQDLRDAKQGYELVSAIGNGVNTVSNRFGAWYMNNPINPYYAYGTYGTTIV